jgi:hypothetical protein
MRARGNLVGKDLRLLDQHRRLDGVEATVEADADAIVFSAAFAVLPASANPRIVSMIRLPAWGSPLLSIELTGYFGFVLRALDN